MNKTDILAAAKKHSIRRDIASPDFFEGALLGNGDLGVVVCTRPDALVMYLGHNNIWDIRIEEGHKDKIGTFEDVWARICSAEGDVHEESWYKKYVEEVTASYHDYIYPRPYPASSLYLYFDRKEYEVLGHELDIASGLVTVTLENTAGKKTFAEVFVSQETDTVHCRTINEEGEPVSIFWRLLLVPHTPDGGLPDYQVLDHGFQQLLPYNDFAGEVRPGVDKGFSVLFQLDGEAQMPGLDTKLCHVSGITLQVTQGTFDQVERVKKVTETSFDESLEAAKNVWKAYWECSGITLADEFLEHIWYVNTYFSRCVLSGNSKCPGLFGNWMYKNIGTAWHGDYHMNYNTQQLFWGLMSSNRMELHMPYLRLTEELLPVSQSWARDFYGLRGACFPHSAYPVPMTVMPYPSPDWGWEIFETPWTVQSLWWHYTYTQDKVLLKDRIYPVLREAVLFLTDYMTRDGANPKGDNQYHLYPTIVPELYGLSRDMKLNLDGAVDLTFTKFVFKAMLEAAAVLGVEREEAVLLDTIRKILAAYPEYPTADSRWGEVYVAVENEDPDHVIYNCPANLMQIFPGEDVDKLSADPDEYKVAENSWYHHYNEGGNDLVFYHLIGARLGLIDLEKFKRHIRYSLMPNETATDMVTLTGGRYEDTMNMAFMARMGVWTENFSLYAVINECLLWGHRDEIVLFPNWDLNKAASFTSLRTRGAFLVDAACADGHVTEVTVTSECGGMLKLRNPWNKAVDQHGKIYEDALICCSMNVGEWIELKEWLG